MKATLNYKQVRTKTKSRRLGCVDMKMVLLFVLFIANVVRLSAQTTPVIITPAGDSTKSSSNTKGNKSLPAKKGGKAKPAAGYITDNIAKAKTCSKFFNAMEAAGLLETFKSNGPITIFVPDDEAFAKLPKGRLDTLVKPGHKPELIALITYHAVAGKLSAKQIAGRIHSSKNGAIFTTLAGSKLTAKMDENGDIILVDDNGGQSTVGKNGMEQSNGMLFIINTVLVPKNRLL